MPLMSQVYRLTTIPESNDKGSWYGWDISRDRQLDLSNDTESSIFDTAVGFSNSVKQGEVQVKSEAENFEDNKKVIDQEKEIM